MTLRLDDGMRCELVPVCGCDRGIKSSTSDHRNLRLIYCLKSFCAISTFETRHASLGALCLTHDARYLSLEVTK